MYALETNIPRMKTDPKTLELIMACSRSSLAKAGYEQAMIKEIPDAGDQAMMQKMVLEEIKHQKMFSDIYRKLTGEQMPENSPPAETHKPTGNLGDDCAEGLSAELDSVELYRRVYFAFLNTQIRDMLYEIITDTQAHGQRYTYLYAKYH